MFRSFRFPEAAGGLLANVNRWRDQLKLAPVSDATQAGTPMSVAGHDMFFVDLVSEQPIAPDGSKSRILGGIFPANGRDVVFQDDGAGSARRIAAGRVQAILGERASGRSLIRRGRIGARLGPDERE